MNNEAALEKVAALSQLLGTGKFTLAGIDKWLQKEAIFTSLGRATAGGLSGDKKPEENKQKVASAERLGTPFTDGFLMYCIEQGFSGEKTAEMIEKAAASEGRPGQECKQFLEKVLAPK